MPDDIHIEPAVPVPPISRRGMLKQGIPGGDPNSAPRCGAKLRGKDRACRAPAMANGRCRLHGGLSTGPRTPEGIERIRAAHWKHGKRSRDLERFRKFFKAALALPDGEACLETLLQASGNSVEQLKKRLWRPVSEV